MKKTFLFIISLCFTLMLKAQVEKTIELTAGSLQTMLTTEELNTVTNLTITGTIDARDFKTMRDAMPVLADVDMRMATIAAYKGLDGPSVYTSDYDADAIPQDAFFIDYEGKPFLQSVQIPLSTKTIGQDAFHKCYMMTSFPIPSSVTAIHENAFNFCGGLTSISIPESVTSIGKSAFYMCVRLTSVTIPSSIDSIQSSTFSSCDRLVSVDIPSSVTYIGDQAFYCCFALESLTLPPHITTIGKQAFASCVRLSGPVSLPQGLTAIREGTFSNCSVLNSVIIPSSVDSIGDAAFSFCESLTTLTLPPNLLYIGNSAFSYCRLLTGPLALPSTLLTIGSNAFESNSNLTSLILPSSINSIGQNAFSNCSNITSIEANQLFPLPLLAAPYVFFGIDKITTTLHVPFGSKERYANAYGWKDFTTIVEGNNGFLLNSAALNFDVDGGSDSTIELNANFAWTATSNQPWITVTPTTGDSSQLLTITAEANQVMGQSRSGTITLRAEGITIQTIHISQESTSRIIPITPGSLSTILTGEEKRSITNLTLTGSMDARDFKTIHDQMPLLEELDISEVIIKAFTDSSNEYNEFVLYPANTIPSALGWNADHLTKYALAGHRNLAIIKLPISLTGIGYRAFLYCSGLTSIELPSSVTDIAGLTFYECVGLASVRLPSTLTHISEQAFYNCTSLNSIHCYAVNPPDLDTFEGFFHVFENVDTTNCILYVPFGTKETYKHAGEWGYFNNIVEMPGFALSATNVSLEAEQGSTSTMNITSNVIWNASSGETWLTVSPLTGTGNQIFTLTADVNTADTTRTAIVTVSSPGIDSQTIVVIQKVYTTRVAEMAQNRPSINCYPNPFSRKLMIGIQNPKKESITVDIYSMTGQWVKNLTIGNKAEQLSLSWDGSNEQGQQVVPGVYLCRVNEQIRQVVKR